MNRIGRKGRKTHGDVLGAFGHGAAVADPLAGMGDDGLAGVHVEYAALMFDTQHASNDDGDFLELGTLAGLFPALGGYHTGNAHGAMAGIHAPGIFLDGLRLVARRGDDGRAIDQCGHNETCA